MLEGGQGETREEMAREDRGEDGPGPEGRRRFDKETKAFGHPCE